MGVAIVEVSIVPIGTGNTSISEYVARAIKVLKESGLQYELTPMGTIIYGDLDEVLKVIKKMHDSCFVGNVARILTTLKIDDRRDRSVKPQDKVNSVIDKLRFMEDKGDERTPG